MRLGISGTGYVGCVTSVCFTELGHAAAAVDKNPAAVAKIARRCDGAVRAGAAPGFEDIRCRVPDAGKLLRTVGFAPTTSLDKLLWLVASVRVPVRIPTIAPPMLAAPRVADPPPSVVS